MFIRMMEWHTLNHALKANKIGLFLLKRLNATY